MRIYYGRGYIGSGSRMGLMIIDNFGGSNSLRSGKNYICRWAGAFLVDENHSRYLMAAAAGVLTKYPVPPSQETAGWLVCAGRRDRPVLYRVYLVCVP